MISPQLEIALLEARDKIATKEFLIACANHDTARAGQWSVDYSVPIGQIQDQINVVLRDCEMLRRECA